jgi:hypothetical protein
MWGRDSQLVAYLVKVQSGDVAIVELDEPLVNLNDAEESIDECSLACTGPSHHSHWCM